MAISSPINIFSKSWLYQFEINILAHISEYFNEILLFVVFFFSTISASNGEHTSAKLHHITIGFPPFSQHKRAIVYYMPLLYAVNAFSIERTGCEVNNNIN